MVKTIALIEFDGYKEQVEVERINLGHCDGCITLVATNGTAYMTHISNVLIKSKRSDTE